MNCWSQGVVIITRAGFEHDKFQEPVRNQVDRKGHKIQNN